MSAHPTSEAAVRIDLLSRFGVRIGSRRIAADAWPTRRSAELVQLLALADRRRLTRERAAEALWPHLAPDAAAANLRKAAHHARRALGDQNAVVLRGGSVQLFPQREVETDVERFEREGDPTLYRGELLPDAPYETWTQEHRERLRARFADSLRRSGQLERLIEIDPTDEPAYRELMQRDLDRGSLPGAIRWYGRLRSQLRRQLGVAPSAETAALYDEAVAGLSRVDAAFIGRELEVAQATAVLRSDAPGWLVFKGPAGIGKSAICRRFAQVGETEGWKVVCAAAAEDDAPYAPIASVVEQLTSEDPALLTACGDKARRTLGRLGSREAVEPEDRLTRHGVIGALRRLLLAAAEGARIALVLDDAHLADEATIDALQHVNAAPSSSMLVVLAYRPEGAPTGLTRAVARLARTGRLIELELGPLDREDAAALIDAATGTPRATETVERIIDLGQGNPFLTLELARSNVIGVPALSPTASDAVAARFIQLDDEATGAVQRLALAGDGLDSAAAVALTGTGGGGRLRSARRGPTLRSTPRRRRAVPVPSRAGAQGAGGAGAAPPARCDPP